MNEFSILSYACLFSDANITPCEKKRRDSIFYSKKFIPFCKPDGSWSEIQCEKSSRDCWCVDSGGNEVPGTRDSNLENCPDFGLYSFFPLYSLNRASKAESITSILKYLVTLTPRRHVLFGELSHTPHTLNPIFCFHFQVN